MEPILKQPVLIETKAGAAGQIGAQSQPPPSLTATPCCRITLESPVTPRSTTVRPSGQVYPRRLFPLARLIADPVLLLVNEQQPYRTLKELIDGAKAKPDTLVFSSGGLYGACHLPLAYLEKATGPLKLRHLPTSGGGPAIIAILGNNAQVTAQSVSATLPHVKSGKLRPLAIFSAMRSTNLPEVPTLKELGYGVEYYLWVGIFAPKGMAPAIVTTLRTAIGKAVLSEQFKAALTNVG